MKWKHPNITVTAYELWLWRILAIFYLGAIIHNLIIGL